VLLILASMCVGVSKAFFSFFFSTPWSTSVWFDDALHHLLCRSIVTLRDGKGLNDEAGAEERKEGFFNWVSDPCYVYPSISPPLCPSSPPRTSPAPVLCICYVCHEGILFKVWTVQRKKKSDRSSLIKGE